MRKRGKKTLLSLALSGIDERLWRCSIGRRFVDLEILPL